MSTIPNLDPTLLQWALADYKLLYYDGAVNGPVNNSPLDVDPLAALKEKKAGADRQKAAQALKDKQAAALLLPPFGPVLPTSDPFIKKTALLGKIGSTIASLPKPLREPANSAVTSVLTNIINKIAITEKQAYLTSLGVNNKPPATPVNSVNLELKYRTLTTEIENLRSRKDRALLIKENALAEGKTDYANLVNSRLVVLAEEIEKKEADREEIEKRLLAAGKQPPVIPGDFKVNPDNTKKVNEKAVSDLDPAPKVDLPVKPEPVKGTLTSANTPASSAKGGLIITKATSKPSTSLILRAVNPLVQQQGSPTQLLKTDIADFRAYGAVMPFFNKGNKPAYIRLLDDTTGTLDFLQDTEFASTTSSVTGTGKNPTIEDPFLEGALYNQFTATNFRETHNEKHQLVDTNAQGQVLFAFGEEPRMWTINGNLLNDVYNNWLAKLREVWHSHIRLTQLVRKKKYARFVIPSQRIAFDGYPVALSIDHSASIQTVPSFSMVIFVRNFNNMLNVVFEQNSAETAILKNLMYLDGFNLNGSSASPIIVTKG